jgi:hypothetical protein
MSGSLSLPAYKQVAFYKYWLVFLDVFFSFIKTDCQEHDLSVDILSAASSILAKQNHK